MSIQTEIDRINNAKNEMAEAITSKGVPVAEGTSIDDFAGLVRSIPQGGSGEGAVEEIVWITGDLDMATMAINNMSHTHAEIVELINQGKKLEFRASAAGSYAYGTLAFYNPMQDRPCFYAMFQENLGYGLMLYYFNVHIYADNRVVVTPYVVNTTGMGG